MAVQVAPYAIVKPEALEVKHPEAKAMAGYWERVRILLEEDEDCYPDAKFFPRLPNEKEADWKKRMIVFVLGFCNPSQSLVSTKADYIFKKSPDRKTGSADLTAFIAKADRSGQSLNDFMKNLASPILQGYGTLFGVVDKPRVLAVNRLQELSQGMPYLCILQPQQVLTWAWGQDGALVLFRYWQAANVTQDNPFEPIADGGREYVTWTRTEYFRHNKKGERVDYLLHNFGVVPVAIQAAFLVDASKTLGKSSFFSTSRQIMMGNNHLSVANFEIAKYGSVLLIDQQDIEANTPRPREDGTNLPVMTQATADGSIMRVQDMAKPPAYLVKDIKVVETANIQAQWYFQRAADTEATGQEPMPLSGPQGNPESGISKAYDFKDTDANLSAHAQDLQEWEIQVLAIVCAMLGVKTDYSVVYPTSFDSEGFLQKIERIAALQKIGYGSKTGMKAAARRLTSELSTDKAEQKKIDDEVDAAIDAPPAPEPVKEI